MKKNKFLILKDRKILYKLTLIILSVLGVFGVAKTYEIISGTNVMNNTLIPVVLLIFEIVLYFKFFRCF